MLIEQRTYTVAPGKLRDYLHLYEKHGVRVHAENLGHWFGCYVSEIGPLNQVVHLWGFESFEDRMRRRAALAADPRWTEYLRIAAGLVVQQESKLLQPSAFTPALAPIQP
ncbi:NIPSNAP family protein [Caenimonas aquaedulcis]|uniref:NIPSNAP family protein n=1 Tax=Caenimonas aquaedulcis TaxID=2793270 RepID=A0A931H871_9BURK|nr:NIPSNAP family protein [Caenimonas aquaedulcis]MBG9390490.1 NIPSNAP family protein [Caenimonas aquaedulcis]